MKRGREREREGEKGRERERETERGGERDLALFFKALEFFLSKLILRL
jgi:hypothetical protein